MSDATFLRHPFTCRCDLCRQVEPLQYRYRIPTPDDFERHLRLIEQAERVHGVRKQ